MESAGIDFSSSDTRKLDWKYKWTMECPNVAQHTTPGSSADVFLAVDGRLGFSCFHAHCADKDWGWFRDYLEQKIGHKIVFEESGKAFFGSTETTATVDLTEYKSLLATSGEMMTVEPEDIPPFDPSVMTGIYKEITQVAIKGTTIPPTYVYGMAKTFIGALIAGKIKFQTISAEPRYYFTAIGATGASKGASWERLRQTVMPDAAIRTRYGIKLINSIDSSAGLRDLFFDEPADAPVLCYIDEAAGLGINREIRKIQTFSMP